MRQENGQYRSMVILAAVVVCILTLVVLTMGSKPAEAKLAQNSMLASFNQGPGTGNSNPQAPDPTKKAEKPGNNGDKGDKKITICHVPPGNPGNAHTITISINAWKTDGKGKGGHGPGLHGGDYVGRCQAAGAVATQAAATEAPGTSIVPVAWVPISASAPVCADWAVYHTNQTGNWEIFRLGNLPGNPGANANLSQGPGKNADNIGPSLSPDRHWIAFASNRDGNWEVYVAATDGTSRQRVTYHTYSTSTDPVWSPDGTRIVYESNYQGNWDLYAYNVQTGEETQLTDDGRANTNAYWSPDGQNLVYESVDNGLSQVYRFNLATQKSERLSDGQGKDFNPTYSADGKHIAFFSYRNTTNAVLYIMNADGSSATPVSDAAGSVLNPSWSPDSSLIAYQLKRDSDVGIYVFQPASGKTRRVTDGQSLNYAPTWACNGTTLLFTSSAAGGPNLFITEALPIDAAPIAVSQQAHQLTTSQTASQYAVAGPLEEDASTFGPQTATVVLPLLGGTSCGAAVNVPGLGNGPAFPVISTNDCG